LRILNQKPARVRVGFLLTVVKKKRTLWSCLIICVNEQVSFTRTTTQEFVMSHLVSLVIKECAVSMSPSLALQNRPGLIVHDSFSERVLSSLRPVESAAKCRYAALPLRSWLGEPRSYPRLPQNPLPRYDPTSAEIYADLYPREQGMFVSWEHLTIPFHFSPPDKVDCWLRTTLPRSVYAGKRRRYF
jgi:hypothetical protein